MENEVKQPIPFRFVRFWGAGDGDTSSTTKALFQYNNTPIQFM